MHDELKKGWYVDSSPGNSFGQAKCGEIKVSMGISGTSVLSAAPPPPPPDLVPPDIDDHRSTLPPGTHVTTPLTGNIAALATVWFDSQSALYNLPTAADGNSFSISYWFNPWAEVGSGEDDAPGADGVLYGSPTTVQNFTDVSGNAAADTQYFSVEPSNVAEGRDVDCKLVGSSSVTGAVFKKSPWMISATETDPLDEMQGWCHVMLTVTKSGSDYLLTMWVNDTELCTNAPITTNGSGPSFPFSTADYSDDADHFWNIGGKPDRIRVASGRVFVTDVYGATLSLPPGTPMSGIGPTITPGSFINSCVVDYGMFDMGAVDRYPTEANGGKPLKGTYHAGCAGCEIIPSWQQCVLTDANVATLCDGPDCQHISCSPSQWYWASDSDPGKSKGFQPEDPDDGFRGAVTELWIAPGQAVDWSQTAMRYRFHTSDDPYTPGVGGGTDAHVWCPVDLGSTGKGITNGGGDQISGTGTKPLIYLTGPPHYFNYNRAKNNAKLQLFRASSGGIVGELKAYFSVPTQVV